MFEREVYSQRSQVDGFVYLKTNARQMWTTTTSMLCGHEFRVHGRRGMWMAHPSRDIIEGKHCRRSEENGNSPVWRSSCDTPARMLVPPQSMPKAVKVHVQQKGSISDTHTFRYKKACSPLLSRDKTGAASLVSRFER